MKIIPSENDDISEVKARTLAIMLWPDHEQQRNGLVSSLAWKIRLAQDADSVAFDISRSDLAQILQAPSLTDSLDGFEKEFYAGQIAGQLLIFVMLIHDNESDASLRKARFIIRARDLAAVAIEGSLAVRLTSDSAIKKVWNTYRSVAHLWATLILELNGEAVVHPAGRPRGNREIFDALLKTQLSQLANTSSAILDRAQGIVPPRQSGKSRPMLTPETCWTFSGRDHGNAHDFVLPSWPRWAASVLSTYDIREVYHK